MSQQVSKINQPIRRRLVVFFWREAGFYQFLDKTIPVLADFKQLADHNRRSAKLLEDRVQFHHRMTTTESVLRKGVKVELRQLVLGTLEIDRAAGIRVTLLDRVAVIEHIDGGGVEYQIEFLQALVDLSFGDIDGRLITTIRLLR